MQNIPVAWQQRWARQMQDFSAAFSIYAVATDADLTNLPGSIQKIIAQMERRKDSRLFKQWQGSGRPKCTQCGHREILSGKEDSFWKRFQSVIRIEGGRELLCACCLAKRIFAFCDIFPSKAAASTMDITAAPFLDEFSKLAQENSESFQLVMECWSDDVQQHVPGFLRSKPFTDDAWLKKIAELVLPYEIEDEKQRKIVEAANRTYLHSPPENGLGLAPSSPYLAVLMLDGDKMGEHLSKHPKLSDALTEFSQAVPGIIEWHQGTAIYSSGDELLALLPKDSALSATQAVQKKFTDCIKKVAEHIEEEITCSASITWFHCKDPLQQAIKNCREGLMLAKDGFNRNSLVCTVLTNSASEYRSGSPWSFDATQVADELIKLICLLRPDGGLSKNFLHDLLAELPSFGAELAADQDLLSPRLRYLWKRHTKEETAARCACEDRCRFLESMASSLPGVNSAAENFAACLRVAGFLARS